MKPAGLSKEEQREMLKRQKGIGDFHAATLLFGRMEFNILQIIVVIFQF